MTTRTITSRLAATGLILAVGAGATACGSSKASTATGSTSSTTKFCDAIVKADATPLPQGNPSDPNMAGPLKEYFGTVVGSYRAAQTSAPAAAAADLKFLADAADKAVATGQPPAMESPEFQKATFGAHKAVNDRCGFTNVAVRGMDYSFAGVPATLKPGRTSFLFTNATTHNEMHEMVIMRKNDGVTETVQQLLQLPQDQAMTKVQPVATTFASPGQQTGITSDLKAGNYVMVCFIPVGSGNEGPPHAMNGMVSEFRVS